MSGDLLGAELIKALREQYEGEIQFEGIGGAKMIAAGFTSHVEQERLAVMGLVEVLKRLPELLGIRKKIRQHFLSNPPDIFIGIDSPDFNLPIELTFRKAGIATVHYVSPSVWAWRQKRVNKIAKAVDLMLALLPFEVGFYRQHSVPVEFVGHPLADHLPLEPDHQAARELLGIDENDEIIALLPGSRSSEVDMLGKDFLLAARYCVQHRPNLKFIIPAANERRLHQLQDIVKNFSDLNVQLVLGQSHEVMASANMVLMASGTTALEAMLLKRPMVVSYRFSPLTWAIFSRMVKTPFVALPNILAGRQLVPEIIQTAVTPAALGEALLRYFNEPEIVSELQSQFLVLHKQLRLNASQKAATAVLKLVKKL